MSRLKTISDKLDYIAMGKLNAEQMEYICEINQEVNLKDREIERLNNIINKVYKYLDEKKEVPEWWDTDFMICMDILKGGTGYLKDILGSDKE